MTEQESVCYAVVSLLDREHEAKVLSPWEELEREFGLKLRETYIPHFTYHSAERYDLERLEGVPGCRVAEAAGRREPPRYDRRAHFAWQR